MQRWRYWTPEKSVTELHLSDDRAYEEGFRDVFRDAVASCLRSIGPTGIMLSGGIDSSAVAAVARTLSNGQSGHPIHTFTGIFPSLARERNLDIDEQKYVEDVLSKGGFSPHFVRADRLRPLDNIDQMVAARGEPFKLRGHYMVAKLLNEAASEDVRVILDGSEGDAVVGYGYDYFEQLAQEGNWSTFGDLARTYSENCRQGSRRYPSDRAFWEYGLNPLLGHIASGQFGRFAREAREVATELDIRPSALISQGARRLTARLRNGGSTAEGLVEADRLNRCGLLQERETQGSQSGLERRALRLQEDSMLKEALDGIDAVCAGHQVEARHPFYDRRVVEYCLALPPEQRMKGGWTRSIVRRALSEELPESLRTRVGKANLGVNLTRNLLTYEWAQLAETVNAPVLSEYVRPERAEEAFRSFVEEPTVLRARPLLRMTVLVSWLNSLDHVHR